MSSEEDVYEYIPATEYPRVSDGWAQAFMRADQPEIVQSLCADLLDLRDKYRRLLLENHRLLGFVDWPKVEADMQFTVVEDRRIVFAPPDPED